MPLNNVERAAIEAVLTRQSAAWVAGSAAAFAADAQEGVLFTNVVGMFSIGRAPFVAQHEHIFSTIYREAGWSKRSSPSRSFDLMSRLWTLLPRSWMRHTVPQALS